METSTLKTYSILVLAVSLGIAGGNYLANKYIPTKPVITQSLSTNWYDQPINHILPRKRQ